MLGISRVFRRYFRTSSPSAICALDAPYAVLAKLMESGSFLLEGATTHTKVPNYGAYSVLNTSNMVSIPSNTGAISFNLTPTHASRTECVGTTHHSTIVLDAKDSEWKRDLPQIPTPIYSISARSTTSTSNTAHNSTNPHYNSFLDECSSPYKPLLNMDFHHLPRVDESLASGNPPHRK